MTDTGKTYGVISRNL